MLRRFFSILSLLICLGILTISSPAQAAAIDPSISRYLHIKDAIALDVAQGENRLFYAENLSRGKQLFEKSCMNCHVGGSTLPNPQISLSLKDLAGANPPRDTINSLVAYMREPMSYDGSEPTYWCREVPETWLGRSQVEDLAAFILTAAQKAPGWGIDTFEH